MRSDLMRTIDSIRNQIVDANIIVRYDPDVNEYVSRDYAIKEAKTNYIGFIDDDAYYSPYTLEKAIKLLDKYYIVDGSVYGNVFGRGNEKFDMPYLGIGTALFIRKDIYSEVGGFDTQWGKLPSDGWRMDTSLLYKVITKYGDKVYKHSSDIIVNHPNMMQSQWNPYIEWHDFYYSYKDLISKYILPLDPRLTDMIKHKELLGKAVSIMTKNEFNGVILKYHKGVIVKEAYNELEGIVNGNKHTDNVR